MLNLLPRKLFAVLTALNTTVLFLAAGLTLCALPPNYHNFTITKHLATTANVIGNATTLADTPGPILYVDANATGLNDGSSWNNAFTELQAALSLAADFPGYVEQIWVADGTYLPDYDPATGTHTHSRLLSFRLINGVSILGGYAGYGAPDPDARDPQTYVTVLSGDLLGNDGPNFTNRGENSFHVVLAQSVNSTCVLDGFTIKSGYSNGSMEGDPARGQGGGLCLLQSYPRINNCVITDNYANAQIAGGGLYCYQSSGVNVTGCTFSGNWGTLGGAVNFYGSGITLTNCTFIGNTANWSGGAIRGGGGNATVTSCKFIGNTGNNSAGAVSMSGAGATYKNCLFAGNKALTWSGGAIECGTGCVQNIVNCTFAYNEAVEYGGAISNSQDDMLIANSIFWGNTAGLGGSQMYTSGGSYDGGVDITYCDFQGSLAGIYKVNNPIINWGVGNLNCTPSFVDADGADDIPGTLDDNYTLTWGSRCADAGSNSYAIGLAVDLAGSPRFMDDIFAPDTGFGTPPIVDMGAYESVSTGIPEEHLVIQIDGDPDPCLVPGPSTVTVSVYWVPSGAPAPNIPVTIEVTGSDTTSISVPGVYQTNSQGQILFDVTRNTRGEVEVTGSIEQPWTPPVRTVAYETIYFYENTLGWPMFMHNPQHTGMSAFIDRHPSDSVTTGIPTWTAKVPAFQSSSYSSYPIYDSSPVVDERIVVVGSWTSSGAGDVYAFAAHPQETGELLPLWKASTPLAQPGTVMGGVAATPCIYNSKVYAASADGYVYCLDLHTGSRVWSTNVGASVYSSPVVYKDTLFVVNCNGTVFRLELGTGNNLYAPISLATGTYCVSSPALAEISGIDYMLVGCNNNRLYRLRLTDGNVQSTPLTAMVESSPTVVGQYAHVGTSIYSYDNFFRVQIDREPFEVLLNDISTDDRYMAGAEVRATAAYGYRTAYFGCDTGDTFYRVSLHNYLGVPVPRNTLASFVETRPTTWFIASEALTNTDDPDVPGLVFVGNDSGNFHVRRASDLNQVALYDSVLNGSYTAIRSGPAIAYMQDGNGNMCRWVYFTSRTDGGTLFAFKTVLPQQ